MNGGTATRRVMPVLRMQALGLDLNMKLVQAARSCVGSLFVCLLFFFLPPMRLKSPKARGDQLRRAKGQERRARLQTLGQ